MKTQLLNYDTAKMILDGFRFTGCRFSPNFFNKYGMTAFAPKERHTATINVIDPEKGGISLIRVSYSTFCKLYPQPQ